MNQREPAQTQVGNDESDCPACGAKRVTSARAACWLCQELLPELSRSVSPGPVRSWGDNPAFIIIGVLVTLVTLGLAIEAPGLLIVLALATAPALIRASVLKRRAQAAGQPSTPAADLGVFVSSLGAVALVGMIAAAAGYATFFPVCLGVDALGAGLGTSEKAGIFAGIALGLAVFASLIHLLWKRRKT